MPYYKKVRRTGSKYPIYRKRKLPLFGRADKQIARAGYMMARKALKMMNVEYKVLDTQITFTAISNTPTIVQLTNLSQGDGQSNRDGNQVKITRINWRYTYSVNASAVFSFLRVILVLDRQTNQAIYTAGNLLQDVTINDAIVSAKNLDNKFRFKVLYDKVHSMSPTHRTCGNAKYNKNVEIKIRYDANAGDITDLTSNSLSILLVSNEVTNTPSITSFMRLRYVDN